jgi:hypothetical protein
MNRIVLFLLSLSVFGCGPVVTASGGDGQNEGEGDSAEGEGEGEGIITEGEGDGGNTAEGEGDGGTAEGEEEPAEGEGDGNTAEGEGDAGAEGEGEGPPAYDPMPDAVEVYGASELLPRIVDTFTLVMADAVLRVGRTTGTADFSTDPPGYINQPADALVVNSQGISTRYVIASLAFDPQATANTLLTHDHDIRYTATSTNYTVTVDDRHLMGVIALTASGNYTLTPGNVRTFTLTTTGTSTFVFGTNNLDFTNELTRTGTVTGNVALNFSQRERYRAVSLNRFVENDVSGLTVNATVNGHTFAMMGGVVSRAFTDGLAAEVDFWGATTGVMTVDGTTPLQLAVSVTPVSFDVVFLNGAEQTLLEQYAR